MKIDIPEANRVLEAAFPKQGVTVQKPNGPSGAWKIIAANGEVLGSAFDLRTACRQAVQPVLKKDAERRLETRKALDEEVKDFFTFLRERHKDEFDKWREARLAASDPAELNLIRNSWFTSFRGNSDFGRSIRADVFSTGQNAVINTLLATFPPVVATFPSVPDEVVGWLCREFVRPVTHFVYVKHDYRRTGIASTLVAGTKMHSHQTRAGELLFKKHGSLYNPYLLHRTGAFA